MAYDFSNITQQTLPRELMGYLPEFYYSAPSSFPTNFKYFPTKRLLAVVSRWLFLGFKNIFSQEKSRGKVKYYIALVEH